MLILLFESTYFCLFSEFKLINDIMKSRYFEEKLLNLNPMVIFYSFYFLMVNS